ncbi:dihydroneopterin aldolase [Effusibacillus lacus]|uniref:7,8-dihydroneopterin aldolase n=1 Tax=Effusibacillus lacus TaxID=1348429 RepID=A0A292YJS4_9BACL|nr:dihydroneopterin aldolase [Effusibacillus lacus]TCS74496.1 dihydroneopterin aldolase [Effusibacillus lacus]GAX88634.1 dihydroneopterin aldolase [Effusibacillus lacus]
MDKIYLQGMDFYAYHGVFPEEARLGQRFTVDLELACNLRRAGKTDKLEDTLNYVAVYDIVKQTAQEERYNLIETVAETIASRLMEQFAEILSVKVRVTKVTPPIEGIMAGAAVEIKRERQ